MFLCVQDKEIKQSIFVNIPLLQNVILLNLFEKSSEGGDILLKEMEKCRKGQREREALKSLC